MPDKAVHGRYTDVAFLNQFHTAPEHAIVSDDGDRRPHFIARQSCRHLRTVYGKNRLAGSRGTDDEEGPVKRKFKYLALFIYVVQFVPGR